MSRIKFWICLVIAFTLGLFIAWVDSRPTWDDTGITAGSLLIVAGLLGLVAPEHPWLWALAVGVWIPLYAIIAHGNYSLIVVMIIPFIGAYAGALVRKVSSAMLPGKSP
jgi:hypothetical protein